MCERFSSKSSEHSVRLSRKVIACRAAQGRIAHDTETRGLLDVPLSLHEKGKDGCRSSFKMSSK
jgi:hypothetical protein